MSGQDGTPKSFTAGAAITRGQALQMGAADNTVVPTTAANQFIVGFADEDAASGNPVGVWTEGLAPALANAGVTRGHAISPAGNAGRVGGAAYAAATNTRAVAVTAASAAGDLFIVLMT